MSDSNYSLRVFEMLIERIGALEDAVHRANRRVSDMDIRADVRHLVLTPVKSLIGKSHDTDSTYYKLCERLETYMYEALHADVAKPGAHFVRSALEWLQYMGANKINFPLLVQIANMTDDTEEVMKVVTESGLVPMEDGMAFALYQDAMLNMTIPTDADAGIRSTIAEFIYRNRHHWSSVGYRPGVLWVVARY